MRSSRKSTPVSSAWRAPWRWTASDPARCRSTWWRSATAIRCTSRW